jgi:predicted short-subunit dehydrogenase-like oxidoreductase (DUF2520 family)
LALKVKNKIKILVIGSGNIAWHIVSHLSFFKRFEITVYNRTSTAKLKQLQKEFKVNVITDWKKINDKTDVFFICAADTAIKTFALKLKKFKTKALVLHTSGTTPLSDLNGASKNIGVFYPLQTFTFGTSVNWQEVPVFIEANNKKSVGYLTNFAGLFSKTVVKTNSNNRLKLHLAAVIAGNFSNAMYASAYNYLDKSLNRSYFKYLSPLITTTAKKAVFGDPSLVQTGPAARNDKKTQQKHLELLKKNPELKKTYKALSQLILKQKKSNVKLQAKVK